MGRLVTCSIPGCDRPVKARGLCGLHYEHHRIDGTLSASSDTRSLFGKYGGAGTMSGLNHFPRYPKRVTDALHALAETPGLTPDQYERRKAEILRGAA